MRARGTGALAVRFKQPRYKHAMWNMYQRLTNGDESTNNRVESAHFRTKKLINAHHPTIWRFLHALHGVQQSLDFDYHQHGVGVNGRKKPNKYALRDDRIRNIMEEVETRTPIEYLRGIAANLSPE